MQVTFKYDILNELFTLNGDIPDEGSGLPSVYSAFEGRVVLANCSGHISLASIGRFKPTLFEALTGDAQQIIIGLENVPDISRSALGALVDFAAAVIGRGKKLYLLSPPEGLIQTLKDLQLTMFFKVLQNQGDFLCVLPDE